MPFHLPRHHHRRDHQFGFTLVEVIFVVLILGIVAAIGSSYLVATVNTYRDTQARANIVQRARLAIEQMSRQLRLAVPNSVRVSSSGACIEFMPMVAGTNYQGELPDSQNSAASVTEINTSAFDLGLGETKHAIVGAFFASEIYTNTSPSARARVSTVAATGATEIQLANSTRFVRNSIVSRVYLGDDPVRYCITGGNLYQYSAYGLLTSDLNDNDPGGRVDLLGQNIQTTTTAFVLSPGSEDRNTAVFMDLSLIGKHNTLRVKHEVLIRNVP